MINLSISFLSMEFGIGAIIIIGLLVWLFVAGITLQHKNYVWHDMDEIPVTMDANLSVSEDVVLFDFSNEIEVNGYYDNHLAKFCTNDGTIYRVADFKWRYRHFNY
jgi:hypothetical protein